MPTTTDDSQPAAAPTVCSAGPLVWMRVWAKLPARCVKCNEPAAGPPIRHTFADSAVGAAPHGAMTGIIYVLTRRTMSIDYHLCQRHRTERAMVTGITAALVLVGVAAGVAVALIGPRSEVWAVAAVCPLFAGVGVLVPYRMWYLKGNVSRGWLRFSGAGWAFLGSLPNPPAEADDRR